MTKLLNGIMGLIGDLVKDTYCPKGSFGPKQKNLLMKWIPSLAFWGITGFAALVYITEWQAVLSVAPYYSFRPPYIDPTMHLSRKHYDKKK